MRRVSLFAAVLMGIMVGSVAWAATPPGQPERGPGGKDYVEAEVVKRAIGTAEQPVYVFHGKSTPARPRPVVVLFHSWGGNDPRYFGGWIEHLVRKGNLVIFPRFQEVNRTRPVEAPAIAARMVRDALKTLSDDEEARPNLSQVSYVGYLAGSIVALDVAAASNADLPQPKLVLCLMPGGVAKAEDDRGIKLEDISRLPASTMLLVMNGDQEHAPADRVGKMIFNEASGIPAANKLFIRIGSDRHGFPTLSANLVSPGSNRPEYAADKIPLPPSTVVAEEPAPPVKGKGRGRGRQQARKAAAAGDFKWTPDMALSGIQTSLTMMLGGNVTDIIDSRGFWKTLDLALATVAEGKDALALKANPALADMGAWSDEWPVRRISAETPKETPPVTADATAVPVAAAPAAYAPRRRR